MYAVFHTWNLLVSCFPDNNTTSLAGFKKKKKKEQNMCHNTENKKDFFFRIMAGKKCFHVRGLVCKTEQD